MVRKSIEARRLVCLKFMNQVGWKRESATEQEGLVLGSEGQWAGRRECCRSERSEMSEQGNLLDVSEMRRLRVCGMW